jgi:hypothetical protein
MESKQFHLGDILSITTGCLVSPRGMDAVYEILGYMTGDTLWTHQLPRVAKECRPWLFRQHPQLEAVKVDAMPPGEVEAWLADQVKAHGEMLPVSPIPKDDHERKNPLQEMIEMRGSTDGIVVVKVDEPKS